MRMQHSRQCPILRALMLALVPGAFAACWVAGAAGAATYYVAPGGNDAGPGTLAAPWKSFARAEAGALPGDTVYFRGGAYVYTAALNPCASMTGTVNAITLGKSGQPGQPIRYWAYPGERPVFDFSRVLDNCRARAAQARGRSVTAVALPHSFSHSSVS